MNLNFYKKKKNIFILTMSILLAVLILFIMSPAIGCRVIEMGNNSTGSQQQAGDLAGKDSWTVGTDASYPPFEFLNKEGNIEGFDIDIINKIATDMEKKVTIENIAYDALFINLQEGKIDLIISAITAMEDKKDQVDYSQSYYVLEYTLLVLSDTEIKLKEELANKEIGILDIASESLGEDILSNYRIQPYKDIKVMSEDLRNKKIDGAIVSIPIAVNLLGEVEKPYKVIEVFKSSKEFVIALRKNSGVLEEINGAIEDMHENNTFVEIYDKWFFLD
ncbi:MAG: ABC transporter substrate-binding protein [Candidatus Humimicrobiaceae bacterium]